MFSREIKWAAAVLLDGYSLKKHPVKLSPRMLCSISVYYYDLLLLLLLLSFTILRDDVHASL